MFDKPHHRQNIFRMLVEQLANGSNTDLHPQLIGHQRSFVDRTQYLYGHQIFAKWQALIESAQREILIEIYKLEPAAETAKYIVDGLKNLQLKLQAAREKNRERFRPVKLIIIVNKRVRLANALLSSTTVNLEHINELFTDDFAIDPELIDPHLFHHTHDAFGSTHVKALCVDYYQASVTSANIDIKNNQLIRADVDSEDEDDDARLSGLVGRPLDRGHRADEFAVSASSVQVSRQGEFKKRQEHEDAYSSVMLDPSPHLQADAVDFERKRVSELDERQIVAMPELLQHQKKCLGWLDSAVVIYGTPAIAVRGHILKTLSKVTKLSDLKLCLQRNIFIIPDDISTAWAKKEDLIAAPIVIASNQASEFGSDQSAIIVNYLTVIALAKQKISIMTPNLNDSRLLHGLRLALIRGVKVEILLCYSHNDSRVKHLGGRNRDVIANLASCCPSAQLDVRWQVDGKNQRIEHGSADTVHDKELIVDDEVMVRGTANHDEQSTRNSSELNVTIFSPEIVAKWQAELFIPLFSRGERNDVWQAFLPPSKLARAMQWPKQQAIMEPEKHGLEQFQLCQIVSTDDVRINCWYFKSADPNARCIILFHGTNRTLISESSLMRMNYLANKNYHVVCFDWRNVGSSSPGPMNKIKFDDIAVMEFVQQTLKIPVNRIYLYGWSGGSGHAAMMMAKYPEVAGLILQCPYAKLVDVFPLGSKAADCDLDTEFFVSELVRRQPNKPILIMHSLGDKMIDFSHALRLVCVAGANCRFVIYDECGHGDMPRIHLLDQLSHLIENPPERLEVIAWQNTPKLQNLEALYYDALRYRIEIDYEFYSVIPNIYHLLEILKVKQQNFVLSAHKNKARALLAFIYKDGDGQITKLERAIVMGRIFQAFSAKNFRQTVTTLTPLAKILIEEDDLLLPRRKSMSAKLSESGEIIFKLIKSCIKFKVNNNEGFPNELKKLYGLFNVAIGCLKSQPPSEDRSLTLTWFQCVATHIAHTYNDDEKACADLLTCCRNSAIIGNYWCSIEIEQVLEKLDHNEVTKVKSNISQ